MWGRFATQASSGRYTFSQVNQPNRHFAETLVGSILEADGYVCWTAARILRKPSHAIGGFRGFNTRLIEALLSRRLVLHHNGYTNENTNRVTCD